MICGFPAGPLLIQAVDQHHVGQGNHRNKDKYRSDWKRLASLPLQQQQASQGGYSRQAQRKAIAYIMLQGVAWLPQAKKLHLIHYGTQRMPTCKVQGEAYQKWRVEKQ